MPKWWEKNLAKFQGAFSRPVPSDTAKLDFECHFDSFERDGVLKGWVWCSALPEFRVALDLFCNGIYLGKITADQFRADLLEAKKGDGRHAFEFNIKNVMPNYSRYRKLTFKAFTDGPLTLPVRDRTYWLRDD